MAISVWAQGGKLQGLAAVMRLAFGVLFAWVLLRAFGTSQAGIFWAKAVYYQIAFTLCGFGLPYGIVHRQKRAYAFFNPEVKAALTLIALSMAVLLAGIWLMLDRDLVGVSVGFHFFVNRLVFMVIFFRRNALEFKRALQQQLAYDASVIIVLLVAWGAQMSFEGFVVVLLILNSIWVLVLVRTAQLGRQSISEVSAALRRAFTDWRFFSARTYITEIVGLVLNGFDRLVLASLGHADFLAVYVLARKVYEVPHNIMTAQSSFVFAIMVKLTGQEAGSETTIPCRLTRTRLTILVSYEILAMVVYGLLALSLLQFGLIMYVGDVGEEVYRLAAFFLMIGLAQASLIPLLNLTYAQGNAHFILNYTVINAVLGSTLLVFAWLQDSLMLVLMSQEVIVLTSWSFMVLYVIREFGLRLGCQLALAKGGLLLALHVWFVYVLGDTIFSIW